MRIIKEIEKQGYIFKLLWKLIK